MGGENVEGNVSYLDILFYVILLVLQEHAANNRSTRIITTI